MKRLVPFLRVITVAVGCGLGFSSCTLTPPTFYLRNPTPKAAQWLKNCNRISWLPRQVSGRYDGASALDNLNHAAAGYAVKRSSYGTAPGGYVGLNHRMLWAICDLASRGYTFRVVALAGGSHARNSRHYAGLAFDVKDHRVNTRTVILNPILSWLYVKLEYHIEHHMFPQVPLLSLGVNIQFLYEN